LLHAAALTVDSTPVLELSWRPPEISSGSQPVAKQLLLLPPPSLLHVKKLASLARTGAGTNEPCKIKKIQATGLGRRDFSSKDGEDGDAELLLPRPLIGPPAPIFFLTAI